MGEVFAGRYELIDQIGLGGMGSIWRVRDRKTGATVAAKVLRQSQSGAVLRFIQEQAVRIQHPHIIVPIGWAGEDDRVLFTMPIVDGGSVSTLIGDFGALPALFAAEVLRQMGQAVAAVHAARIIHRDIKPSNILLEATGTARPHAFLTDFGISVDLDGPRFTTGTVIPGTPGYIAPELYEHEQPSPGTDVFALGVVAAAMLCGGRPERIDEHLPANCPPALWEIVRGMTQPDPTLRSTLGEVFHRLEDPGLAWTDGAIGDVEVFTQVSEVADVTLVRNQPPPRVTPPPRIPTPGTHGSVPTSGPNPNALQAARPQFVPAVRPMHPIVAAGPPSQPPSAVMARVAPPDHAPGPRPRPRKKSAGILLVVSAVCVVIGVVLVVLGLF